ncbi:MAG: hypothetical protein JO056_12185 [Alphaproteobacteria bacterium]|nr:hypothetical protein [Alphaproteobacteria bacterium]
MLVLRTTVILAVTALLGACAGAGTETTVLTEPVSEHVTERNFSAGETRQAFVGDTMIRVKDYYRKKSESAAWSIPESVKVEMPVGYVTIVPGEYRVRDRQELNGIAYDVIEAKAHLIELTTMAPSPTTVEQPLLIDAEGGIRGPANAWATGATTADKGFRATRVDRSSVDARRHYVNFELVYGGLSGGVVHVAYRERDPQDPSRIAVAQELTYDAGTNPLRFRNLLLDVGKATNESITFRVVNVPAEWSAAEVSAEVAK